MRLSLLTMTDPRLINSDLYRFILMLVCRMIMSLREFVASQPPHISTDLPTGLSADLQDTSSPAVDGIQLSVFKERQTQPSVS